MSLGVKPVDFIAHPLSPRPPPLSDVRDGVIYMPKDGLAQFLEMDLEILQSPRKKNAPVSLTAVDLQIPLNEIKRIITEEANSHSLQKGHTPASSSASQECGPRVWHKSESCNRKKGGSQVLHMDIENAQSTQNEGEPASNSASRISDGRTVHIPCKQIMVDEANLHSPRKEHIRASSSASRECGPTPRGTSNGKEGGSQVLEVDLENLQSPRKESAPSPSRISRVSNGGSMHIPYIKRIRADEENSPSPRRWHTPASNRASHLCGVVSRGTTNGKAGGALSLQMEPARFAQLPQRSLPASQNLHSIRKGYARVASIASTACDHHVAQTRLELSSLGDNLSCARAIEHCGVKLVVFDFDCTLTSFHVFSSLAGIVQSTSPMLTVPPPHARSEDGQLERLYELDNDPNWGLGVFALKAFGGPHRLTLLRSLLERLRQSRVECVILSRGMSKPIRRILAQVNLLSFFSHIHGNEGGALGHTAYDEKVTACKALPRQSRQSPVKERSCQLDAMKPKVEKLQRIVRERNLDFGQAVFIDDEFPETERASCTCRVIHISSGIGMQEQDMKLLLRASKIETPEVVVQV